MVQLHVISSIHDSGTGGSGSERHSRFSIPQSLAEVVKNAACLFVATLMLSSVPACYEMTRRHVSGAGSPAGELERRRLF